MPHISAQDIAAIGDILDRAGEDSDSLSVEEAVATRVAAIDLKKKTGVLIGLVDTQLTTVLESPREFDGVRYKVINDEKWRPDHAFIRATVKERSLVDVDTGELRSAEDAVRVAIDLLYDMFVSASTFPKTKALDDLQLWKNQVGSKEITGKKVDTEVIKTGGAKRQASDGT